MIEASGLLKNKCSRVNTKMEDAPGSPEVLANSSVATCEENIDCDIIKVNSSKFELHAEINETSNKLRQSEMETASTDLSATAPLDPHDARHVRKSQQSDIPDTGDSFSTEKHSLDDTVCDGGLGVEFTQSYRMKPLKFMDTYSPVSRNPVSGSLPNKTAGDIRRWRLASTDRLNTLIDECERQINGRKLYVCKFCGKVYEIKSSMRYHMKIIHLQMHLRTTEMQCRICGKQFTCVSAVNRHQAKCILATYPDPNTYRSKQPSVPLSGTYAPPKDLLGSSGFDSDSMTNAARQSTLQSTFNGIYSSPLSGTSSQNYPLLANSTLGQFPAIDGAGDNNILNTSLSPSFGTATESGRRANAEIHHNGWPNLSPFNTNLSDVTSLQLEMCMKAVVQGLQNKVTSLYQTSHFSEPHRLFDDAKSEVCVSDTTHRSSFSSAHTPSDVSDVAQTPPITVSDEVAMDLSSRSHSESVMIESF